MRTESSSIFIMIKPPPPPTISVPPSQATIGKGDSEKASALRGCNSRE
jgi:hypothetical protein